MTNHLYTCPELADRILEFRHAPSTTPLEQEPTKPYVLSRTSVGAAETPAIIDTGRLQGVSIA